VFAKWYASGSPVTTAPINKPATAVGPKRMPKIIGETITIMAGFQSSLIDAAVAISTHLA